VNLLKAIKKILSRKTNVVNVTDIDHSTVAVTVVTDSTIINRLNFEITEEWFEKLLSITYDAEIKSKYIPELHQSTEFEKNELRDISDFNSWKQIQNNQIRICRDYLQRFKQSFSNFYQILQAESINITDDKSLFVVKINTLNENIEEISGRLVRLSNKFNRDGYQTLNEISKMTEILNVPDSIISFKRDDWSEFLDREPTDYHTLRFVFQHYNQVYYNLNELNRTLIDLRANVNHKVIVGNAGSGKTHITAHLIKIIRNNKDSIIFLKPKQFNGDNVYFEDRLLKLLEIPSDYRLTEVLDKLNSFSKIKNKRCFIIIDALNETTKSSIGFSNIWESYLQSFLNQINLYSHLYFVCTLRTSYIEQIWRIKPSNIIEIKGFQKYEDVEEVCKKYFSYYNIRVSNFYTADLTYFKTPLLLDLFCKLTNEKRDREKEITLDIHSYRQVFEDYIDELVAEVRNRLNLQKTRPIKEGFSESSNKFWQNNEATISVDEFSDAFDKNDSVSKDESIARSVLEGYLIFIKDISGKNNEIIKHTQQEVGGYLLAKKLSDEFPDINELFNNPSFNEKILGDEVIKHHQLRLDILKFLIALRPELILNLKGVDGLKLSWWYLYNGYSNKPDTKIPAYLLKEEKSKLLAFDILNISSIQWFNPHSSLNFDVIAQLLNQMDLWEFEKTWTFYLYDEADFFYEFLDDHIKKIKESDDSSFAYEALVAKFISYVISTNIRELRDFATIYLIEFGNRYPISLLDITEYSSTLKDEYIYERLASCCYGVALNLQNNDIYIQKNLPEIAKRLYDLQFADYPKASVYNYIVIDSIKHLLDLAILKKVFNLNERELKRLSNYEYVPPHEWIPPSADQLRIINESNYMSYPDPIRMDFGIYTIPRLMIENHINDRNAISNVYKRIFELGYRDLEKEEFTDETFRAFYWGTSIRGHEGKVDRLGKKYSWKGFFDYAGYLLLNKQLDVFETVNTAKIHYERLGDVDIDICLPNQDYKLNIRIYPENLLSHREINAEWYNETKIDTIIPFFEYSFANTSYVMLHGMVQQMLDKEYKVRSYLLVETFFIKNNKNVRRLKTAIANKVFDWDNDLHFSTDRLRNVYFGELYWADNFYEYEDTSISIPTGLIKESTRIIDFNDLRSGTYSLDQVGENIKVSYPEKLTFESENTLAEYLWESNSKILHGFSEYLPSIKMGKELGLRAEPSKGKILDSNFKDSFQCVEHKDDNFFENIFNYMRTDLLRKYMRDNDLILLYQVKQHSYDENNEHNRRMKFYILD
jgi:hypothetical protein